MNIKKFNEVDDNKKLIRIVHMDHLEKTLGMSQGGEIHTSFPLNFLSYYKDCEDESKKDQNEGAIMLKFKNGQTGSCSLGSNVLVSCWTIVSDDFKPEECLIQYSNKNNVKKEDYFIMASTIGTVKKVFNDLVGIFSSIQYTYHLFEDEFKDNPILAAICGSVVYYSKDGMPLNKEQHSEMQCHEIIFYKTDHFKEENEFRLAIICNLFRLSSGSIRLKSDCLVKGFLYPDLILKNKHYIDKFYYYYESQLKEYTPNHGLLIGQSQEACL